MKLEKQFFEDMIKSARIEQEKAKSSFERQAGVIGFCEYILKNGFLNLEEVSNGSEKSS